MIRNNKQIYGIFYKNRIARMYKGNKLVWIKYPDKNTSQNAKSPVEV